MGKRLGTLLEKNTERLFMRAGFKTQRDTIVGGYEIDILAVSGNLKIAVQCKQYEKSKLNIRDIIHQWNSKNTLLNFDRVVIVIFGEEIRDNDRILAKQLGISLWSDSDMDFIEEKVIKDPDNANESILEFIGLKRSYQAPEYKEIKNPFKLFFTIIVIFFSIFISIAFPVLILLEVIGGIIYLIIRHGRKK